MNSFIAGIPTYLLLTLVAFAILMTIYLVEVVAYYRFARWYYRTGPAILRERWQTSATETQIRQIIRPLLETGELVGRESAHGFCFRQRGATVNAWTRFMLRIEETQHGAALHYEVRPFYSIVPLVLPLWPIFSTLGVNWRTLFSMAGTIAIVFAIYKWIMPWDVKRMDRLPTVRAALAPFGLLVCERCGYDLFSHSDANRCPECGNDNPEQSARMTCNERLP